MKLIFIYGPPASGKLTIAEELTKITNFKLYHNHLAHDLVASIFDYEKYKQTFFTLTSEINFFMLSKAAKKNISNVIFTNCYYHPEDIKFTKNIVDIVTKYKGEVNFVQIICDKSELLKRVTEKSRKKYGKLKNTKELQDFFQEKNVFEKIPHVYSLSINNTFIPAKNVAEKIKKYYNLK